MNTKSMKMWFAAALAAGTLALQAAPEATTSATPETAGAAETAAQPKKAQPKKAKAKKAKVKKSKAPRDAARPTSRMGLKNKQGFWWKARHEQKLAEIQASGGAFDVVLLGDSITHRWDREGYGTNVLARLEKTYKILNLGIGADHTENVLWRVTEGKELEGYEAKVVTLMIGTNNSLGFEPANVAEAIKKIVGIIREKQPKAKIILHAILPRYGTSEEKVKRRANNAAVNEIIKGLADGENVFWLDLTPKFPPVEGDAYKAICPDGTHPNEKGYEIWTAELMPYLKKYVGK